MQVHDLCISSEVLNVPNGPMLLMIWIVKADVQMSMLIAVLCGILICIFNQEILSCMCQFFNDQRVKIQARDSQRKSHVEVPGTAPDDSVL